MSIESRLQTGNLKNICTYCNTILHLTENAQKEYLTGGGRVTGIIVVFPNKDNATNIRNLLARGGMDVIGVCSTGAQGYALCRYRG